MVESLKKKIIVISLLVVMFIVSVCFSVDSAFKEEYSCDSKNLTLECASVSDGLHTRCYLEINNNHDSFKVCPEGWELVGDDGVVQSVLRIA